MCAVRKIAGGPELCRTVSIVEECFWPSVPQSSRSPLWIFFLLPKWTAYYEGLCMHVMGYDMTVDYWRFVSSPFLLLVCAVLRSWTFPVNLVLNEIFFLYCRNKIYPPSLIWQQSWQLRNAMGLYTPADSLVSQRWIRDVVVLFWSEGRLNATLSNLQIVLKMGLLNLPVSGGGRWAGKKHLPRGG